MTEQEPNTTPKRATLEFREHTYSPYMADFSELSWKEALVCALGYLLQPLALPVIIVLSKIRRKPIYFLKVRMRNGR